MRAIAKTRQDLTGRIADVQTKFNDFERKRTEKRAKAMASIRRQSNEQEERDGFDLEPGMSGEDPNAAPQKRSSPSPDLEALDELEEQLLDEIQRREVLKRGVKSLARNFLNLTIDVLKLKMAVRRIANQSHAASRPPSSSAHMRCESGVKSSGQLESNEISSQSINFAQSFLSIPHVLVAASMAAEFETEDSAQEPSGAVDFHLRKRHVTLQLIRAVTRILPCNSAEWTDE